MEITFKYKDKVITTPNLEKKLKRMKIQLSDIEIIESCSNRKKDDSELDDFHLIHKPYLEPIDGGYALRYLSGEPPPNWIQGKIVNGSVVPI